MFRLDPLQPFLQLSCLILPNSLQLNNHLISPLDFFIIISPKLFQTTTVIQYRLNKLNLKRGICRLSCNQLFTTVNQFFVCLWFFEILAHVYNELNSSGLEVLHYGLELLLSRCGMNMGLSPKLVQVQSVAAMVDKFWRLFELVQRQSVFFLVNISKAQAEIVNSFLFYVDGFF